MFSGFEKSKYRGVCPERELELPSVVSEHAAESACWLAEQSSFISNKGLVYVLKYSSANDCLKETVYFRTLTNEMLMKAAKGKQII